jgi:hypothetical protein
MSLNRSDKLKAKLATTQPSASPAKSPELDVSNLSKEELDQLKKVLQKQEQFESEIENSIQ